MAGPITGIIVPLITPFRGDRVDLAGLAWLVERLVNAGVSGLFVGSTTGEYTRLSVRELYAAASVVREYAGDVPVYGGVTSDSTRTSVEMALAMRDLGIDGVVLAPPFFLRPPDAGLVRHFVEVASKSELQVILYNIPSAVGYEIPPEVVARAAAEASNIVGLKSTSYDLSYPRRVSEALADVGVDSFSLLAGLDDLLLPFLALGGDGAIVGLANAAPEVHLELFKAWEEGSCQKAINAHRKILELVRVYELAQSFPCSVKAAVRARGAPIEPVCRQPDGKVMSHVVEEARSILRRVGVEPWE